MYKKYWEGISLPFVITSLYKHFMRRDVKLKTLKPNIYKNIASILCSSNETFVNTQTEILFSRILNEYPSKSIFCDVSKRILHYHEQNIKSITVIIEAMRNQGEDEEIISNIEMLNKNPIIKTLTEVKEICRILADYIRYAKILKQKDSFLSTLDIIDDDDDVNTKKHVDDLYKMATNITNAYHSINIGETSNTFDSDDTVGMRHVVAEAQDYRKPSKSIVTGIRGLNTLLSPAYLSGCLYVYQSCPGGFKSGILLTSHVHCCKYNQHIIESLNGKKPISIYISMENTMAQTVNRLWSILFPTCDISTYSVNDACDMINKELTSTGFRSIILYYGYREKSTYDIGQIIQSYNDDNNEVVALFLDYIKRLRPARTDIAATSSEKAELHAIMNELKLLCATLNIPIVTAHQLNRQAAANIDAIVQKGGYDKTDEAVGRSNTGSALN